MASSSPHSVSQVSQAWRLRYSSVLITTVLDPGYALIEHSTQVNGLLVMTHNKTSDARRRMLVLSLQEDDPKSRDLQPKLVRGIFGGTGWIL